MAETLFKKIDYTLAKLIQDIEFGEIGLPDIQRPFIWPATKVRDLFDSMYKGFPVGYLLFWANTTKIGTRQIGTGEKQKTPRLLIVDGQQRLTSLFAVLRGKPVLKDDFTEQHIQIAFRPRDAHFEVADAATRRDPEFIPDISRIWSGRRAFEREFLGKLCLSREVSEQEGDNLSEAIDRLYDLQNYPFTVLELSSTMDEEKVAEVFVRINSKGVPLNQADFILTLMSVFWDQGRFELEKFCRDAKQPSGGTASPFNHFIKPSPDQMLRVSVGLGFRRARLKFVYSILRGKDLETEQFSEKRRIQQFEVLRNAQSYVLHIQNWHEFLKCLVRAGYRSESMISSQLALVYSYVLFLIGKQNYGVDNFTLRNVIARWFFMSALSGRYTDSPESVMEADLARFRSVTNGDGFVSTLDRIVHDTFTEDYWNIALPNALATSAARGPSLFAYHAALNLLDAKALFSKIKVSELLDPNLRANKSPVERHHLFPRNYLKLLNIIQSSEVNQIANYAFTEWSDNIEISDLSPKEYLPKYLERFSAEELEAMYFHHALPPGWENLEYQDFLPVRRKLIANVIRRGFEKLES
jgi:hypothetical protein